MKLFIKILLFVFVALITNVEVVSASITFPNIQEATISFSFHTEIPKTVSNVDENDLANSCQNGNDLVDCRDWVIGVEAVAAKGVTAPKGWITKASGKGGGVKFVDPKNPHNQIRQMPGNPNSSFPAQQNPYIKYMKDGKFYDVKGNPLPSGNIPEAHIPLNQFNINNMPKF